MDYLDKRASKIAEQLLRLRTSASFRLPSVMMKEGRFNYPSEADASEKPWTTFKSAEDTWRGKDRHFWFRFTASLPEGWEGRPAQIKVATQLDTWDYSKNPQFLLFVDGEPRAGLDLNHTEVVIPELSDGKEHTFDMQAWTGEQHGEFDLNISLERTEPEIERLYFNIVSPLEAFGRMAEDSKARLDLTKAINGTVNLIDLRHPYSGEFWRSVDEANKFAEEEIYGRLAGKSEQVASCIGHTHIDLAWLWDVAQTRDKGARSFATVVDLMGKYPSFKFMSSQPALYEMAKDRYPGLYSKIKDLVAQGRWEPEGGMYVEADCNLTSGESLARQFLFGKKFFRDEFGKDSKVLWLPDVFGYSGNLPQIMKEAGIDYFMTTKVNWNQYDKMPHDTFTWRGIDGSEVLAHLICAVGINQPLSSFFTTYNGMLHGDVLVGSWQRYQDKAINDDILICYGYGDGGGGVTKEMLEKSKRFEKGIEGIPRVEQKFALDYFREVDRKVSGNNDLGIWEGELYFEYHRGTLTSQSDNKRNNRRSEFALMDSELWTLVAGTDRKAELDGIWRKVLFNQFHDIIPGSSIRKVYEDTDREYAEILPRLGGIVDSSLKVIAKTDKNHVTVFNSTGFPASGLVEVNAEGFLSDSEGNTSRIGNGFARVENIPPKGWKVFEIVKEGPEAEIPFKTTGTSIETPFYKVSFSSDGSISSLLDKRAGREVAKGLLNELVVFEDKPMNYDAWDLDIYYTEKSWKVDAPLTSEWILVDSERAVLRQERRFCASTITQEITFFPNSPRIDFRTTLDWHERQCFMKSFFDLAVHTDEATFDIQFGSVRRKTHVNTSWDKARFESCGQKWVDVSEARYGVALLNDAKYGHSVRNAKIGLSLVKSAISPDPEADQGRQTFTYSLLAHLGNWTGAGVVAESYMLNQPLRAVNGKADADEFSFVSTDADNIVVETVKRSEDGKGVVVRAYESINALTPFSLTFARPVKKAWRTNLLEEKREELEVDGKTVKTVAAPYGLVTVLVEF